MSGLRVIKRLNCKSTVSSYYTTAGYSALGCSYWYKHVSWPSTMFKRNCCDACHNNRCHDNKVTRETINYKFIVCCKVAKLCLKPWQGEL